jgi:trigger factor
LAELVRLADVPAPEGVVRDEVDQRRQAMTDELERMGASLEEYLGLEGKSVEDVDEELTDAATEGVKVQLLLDTLADQEDIAVSDDEYGHEIVHRAQRVGVPPQQYYDQLVSSGTAAAVYGDVRRGKALALVLERVRITDSEGNQLSLDDLRADTGTDEHDHDHEH